MATLSNVELDALAHSLACENAIMAKGSEVPQ
jgi:hypothetical protein